jgi:hypothetical protein
VTTTACSTRIMGALRAGMIHVCTRRCSHDTAEAERR